MIRPLSQNDLQTIVEYLIGTDEELSIGLSELGYDPNLYSEMEKWLLELDVFLADDGIWRTSND